MCGRFVVARATSDLLPDLLAGFPELEGRGLPESYNVSPTQPVAAVRLRHGERELARPRWGFVPAWYPDLKKRPQPINARIETVATSGMFRKAFATNRVVIPAQGYYEWVVTDEGKIPHYIFEEGGALAMAGIVTAWPDRTKAEDDPDRWVLSTAIITRDAHVAPGEVHDRMPACLTPASYEAWLDPEVDADSALALLDEDSLVVASALTHHAVSTRVGSPRNDGPDLIEPVDDGPRDAD